MPDLLGYSPNKKGNSDRRGEGFDALRAATYAVFTVRLYCRLFVNSLDSLFRAHALPGLGILSGRLLQVLESEWEEWEIFTVKRRIKT